MTIRNPFTDPNSYSGKVWAACNAAGLTKPETTEILLDQALADGGIEAALARVDTIGQIKSLCAFAGVPDVAADLLAARIGVQEARTILINARADAADALHTDGHPPSSSSVSATADEAIWCQRRGFH